MANILVVDPDEAAATSLRNSLILAGHSCKLLASGALAIQELEVVHYDVVITELKLQGESGIDLLVKVTGGWPGLPVVMVAALSTIPEAVEAMKRGATEFLQKPFAPDEILYVLSKALTGAAPKAAQPPAASTEPGTRLIGQAASMREVREIMRRAASGNATILIRGETGTGKEVVARAVHETSARSARAFVKIDCASLPDALLESELFGYEKGAFTGAVGRKPGRVELAEGGTLFLDEFGEVSVAMQAKLLRLLQDRAFERLGGTSTLRVDVRFVLATHRDLETMVQNGAFRQDLFYRVNVLPLWLPPLRARRDDIEILAKYFCAKFAGKSGRPGLTISPEALRFLRGQRWPGNVRQLENFVERLVVLTDGPAIELAQVEQEFVQRPRFTTQSLATTSSAPASAVAGLVAGPSGAVAAPGAGSAGAVAPGGPAGASTSQPVGAAQSGPPSTNLALDEAVRRAEREALQRALKRTGGNRSVAARVLGVSRATLYNKLKELGIDRN